MVGQCGGKRERAVGKTSRGALTGGDRLGSGCGPDDGLGRTLEWR